MALRTLLAALAREVADEAERNPAFRDRLWAAVTVAMPAGSTHTPPKPPAPARPRGKHRAAAVLDPVVLARRGEAALREALGALDMRQLRDIIAEFGLDPGKQTSNWRKPERLIDRIAEVALARAHKGGVFLDPG